MNRSLLQRLGWPVLMALLSMLAGAALLWFAHEARDRAVQQRVAATQQAREQSERYYRTVQDEATIRKTIARFDSLRERGLIGPEHRLDWADRIRSIETGLRLGRLDFELGPMHLAGPVATGGNDYELAVSRMRLSAGLLHEGDLFDLFDRLLGPSSAIVAPRVCKLAPVDASIQLTQRINFSLTCTLDWMTLNASNSSKAAPNITRP